MTKAATCSVDSCGRMVDKRGMCGMHYQRWRKYGDATKTVKTPNGVAIDFLEQTVMAYEGDECLRWPFCCTNGGYGKLGQSIVARVLCERIHGPPPTPKHEAAHSCNNGSNACVTKRHVSWKTRAENEADKIEHGTSNRGERSAHAKLTSADVLQIRAKIGNQSLRSIAREYGVTLFTIQDIRDRKRWAWLAEDA